MGTATVRVNTETVYSDRREAGVVMASNPLGAVSLWFQI